jgi:hypothetical protein
LLLQELLDAVELAALALDVGARRAAIGAQLDDRALEIVERLAGFLVALVALGDASLTVLDLCAKALKSPWNP